MAKVNVVLDTRKKTKDGRHSLKLRITNGNSSAYILLPYKLLVNEWDKNNCKIRQSCSQFDNVNSENIYILDCVNDFDKFLLEFTKSHNIRAYSAVELKDIFQNKTSSVLIDDVFDQYIKTKLIHNPDGGTAYLYGNTLNHIKDFKKNVQIRDIDVSFLEDFESYLRNIDLNLKGTKRNKSKKYEPKYMSVNTVSLNLRNLRAVVNYAIRKGLLSANDYPFSNYSIKTEKTKHRTIAPEDLIKIFNYDGTESENKAIDLFKLSFYLIGINFKDLLYLKKSDVYKGRIEYSRFKTKSHYSIKIIPAAKKIIKEYSGDQFLLRILEDKIKISNPDRMYPIHKDVTKFVSKYLKRVCEKLGIDIQISTYYARHSWATIARKAGVDYDVIKLALGHKNSDVTAVYIEYDPEIVDRANEVVYNYLSQAKV